MAGYYQHSGQRIVFNLTWDQSFMTRRENVYVAEDDRIVAAAGENFIDKFFASTKRGFDPPEHHCAALKSFLANSDISNLEKALENDEPCATVEDRRDTTIGPQSRRDWESDTYLRWPPEGEDVQILCVNASGLYKRLNKDRIRNHRGPREITNAERRVIYIVDLDRWAALALIATVARRFATLLRDFLQHYLTKRALLAIRLSRVPFHYSFELHLPYYALRTNSPPFRPSKQPRPMFPKHGEKISNEDVYQGRVSLLVVGLDEWLWTAYCCIDRPSESAEPVRYNFDRYLDSPTLGGGSLDQPVWNPREYFLRVAAKRVKQVTNEWNIIAYEVEDRLRYYDDFFFDAYAAGLGVRSISEADFTRIYIWATQLLRVFHNSVTNLIEAWETFQARESQYFFSEVGEALAKFWQEYILSIEMDIEQLKVCRQCFTHKIETLEKVREALVNDAGLEESRAATRQGEDIGALTRVTVIYLPLSLITGVFSIAMVPREAPWVAYITLLIAATTVTILAAFKLNFISILKKLRSWSGIS